MHNPTALSSACVRHHIRQHTRHHIRTVPNWPVPGVQLRHITPLLSNPRESGLAPFTLLDFAGH